MRFTAIHQHYRRTHITLNMAIQLHRSTENCKMMQDCHLSPVWISGGTGSHACRSAERHSLIASSGTCGDNASRESPSASGLTSSSAHDPSLARGTHLAHPANTKGIWKWGNDKWGNCLITSLQRPSLAFTCAWDSYHNHTRLATTAL